MQSSLRCPKIVPSVACVKHLRQIVASTRPFSTTARRDARVHTRARRLFWHWLATKGAPFRNPIPDSTNYLNAYGANGELKRVVAQRREGETQQRLKEQAEERGERYQAPEAEVRHKETPDEVTPSTLSKWKQEKEAKRLEQAAGNKKTNMEADGVGGSKASVNFRAISGEPLDGSEMAEQPAEQLPPEKPSDLVPFPLNPTFKSEPVLSEKFRQKIWEAIIVEGQTVREASARFNVEMSRVGATVRLMEIQKEWERVVSTPFSLFTFHPSFYDDIIKID